MKPVYRHYGAKGLSKSLWMTTTDNDSSPNQPISSTTIGHSIANKPNSKS